MHIIMAMIFFTFAPKDSIGNTETGLAACNVDLSYSCIVVWPITLIFVNTSL